MDEPMQIVLPIVDQMLFEAFGFHFLEPFSTFEEQIKIRPAMNKPPIQRSTDFNFPKAGERPSGSSARPKNLKPIIQ